MCYAQNSRVSSVRGGMVCVYGAESIRPSRFVRARRDGLMRHSARLGLVRFVRARRDGLGNEESYVRQDEKW